MAGTHEAVIREDASEPVLLALYLRQVLGIRSPDDLPHLRGIPPRTIDRDQRELDVLERQWRAYWEMTVEPQAHPSAVPLELVDGFSTLLALPAEGADELRAAVAPHGREAVAYAKTASAGYAQRAGTDAKASLRAYESAIALHERQSGRSAHAFELNVQVLPLTQRGVWWIGALTVAITDGLRADVASFDTAIAPIIAELA